MFSWVVSVTLFRHNRHQGIKHVWIIALVVQQFQAIYMVLLMHALEIRGCNYLHKAIGVLIIQPSCAMLSFFVYKLFTLHYIGKSCKVSFLAWAVGNGCSVIVSRFSVSPFCSFCMMQVNHAPVILSHPIMCFWMEFTMLTTYVYLLVPSCDICDHKQAHLAWRCT